MNYHQEKKISSITADDLKDKLQLLKSGEDYLILEDGENYIQCATSEDSLLFEYQDRTGHYSSSSALSFEKGEEILSLYLCRDSSWKTLTGWESDNSYDNTDTASASGASSGFSSSSTSNTSGQEAEKSEEAFSVGGIMNTIKKTAKKEVKRAVETKTGGLVKDVFRKFMK